jgi:hypothetical protein
MDMSRRLSSVERFAVKFDIDAPHLEPTDANLAKVLRHTMRPPHKLLEPVRRAVVAYRATPERAERIERDQGEPGVPAPGEPGYSWPVAAGS